MRLFFWEGWRGVWYSGWRVAQSEVSRCENVCIKGTKARFPPLLSNHLRFKGFTSCSEVLFYHISHVHSLTSFIQNFIAMIKPCYLQWPKATNIKWLKAMCCMRRKAEQDNIVCSGKGNPLEGRVRAMSIIYKHNRGHGWMSCRFLFPDFQVMMLFFSFYSIPLNCFGHKGIPKPYKPNLIISPSIFWGSNPMSCDIFTMPHSRLLLFWPILTIPAFVR